jgi:hypothetical protein
MNGQPGFFDVDDRLKRLGDPGDHLEAFKSAVDFEIFRAELMSALSYADGARGGRPTGSCGSARIDAQALDVARCAVRHVASTAHQSRRPHCRDEDDDPGSLAGVVPRPGYSASRAWAHTAPRHLSTGA